MTPACRHPYKGEDMATIEEIAEQLDKLSLLDAAKLSKLLQEKWGVSAAAPVAVAAMPGAAGAAGGRTAAPGEESASALGLSAAGGKKKPGAQMGPALTRPGPTEGQDL